VTHPNQVPHEALTHEMAEEWAARSLSVICLEPPAPVPSKQPEPDDPKPVFEGEYVKTLSGTAFHRKGCKLLKRSKIAVPYTPEMKNVDPCSACCPKEYVQLEQWRHREFDRSRARSAEAQHRRDLEVRESQRRLEELRRGRMARAREEWRQESQRPPLTMPFGKFQGRTLQELPDQYLSWLVFQPWLEEKFPSLKNATELELHRRGISPEQAWQLGGHDK
jgi:uncharacterized protein (DUF3820 family)